MDLEKRMKAKEKRAAERPVIFLSQRDAAVSRQQAAEALLGSLLRDEAFLMALQKRQR